MCVKNFHVGKPLHFNADSKTGELRKPLGDMSIFKEIANVNRHIALCYPFPWESVLMDYQFVPSNETIRSLGLQFFPSFWTIPSIGLQFGPSNFVPSIYRVRQISICSHYFNIQNGSSKSRERMVIRENRLWKSRKRISIRENELSESRERFITRENGLSYSRERNTNRIALRHYNLIKIGC